MNQFHQSNRGAQTRFKAVSYIALVVAVFGVSGCASYPEEGAITSFGGAANDLAKAVEQAQITHVQIAQAVEDERAAKAYVVGANPTAEMPLAAKVIDKNRGKWGARLELISAIADYSKALVDLRDPASVNNAVASVSRLSDAVTESAGQLGFANSAQIGGVGSIIAALTRAGLDFTNASAMRRVIAAADPIISRASDLIGRDLETLSTLPKEDLDLLHAERQTLLNTVRRDARSNRVLLLGEYRRAVEEQRKSEALLAIYVSTAALLPKLKAAHHALLTSRDRERTVNDFVASVKQLIDGMKQANLINTDI